MREVTKDVVPEENKIIINFDETKLTASQVRLMKSLNALLLQNMTTQSEGEFFDTCAEMMRVCAGMINQSQFPTKAEGKIPYAKQAIEYSIDVLQEHVEEDTVVRYDN